MIPYNDEAETFLLHKENNIKCHTSSVTILSFRSRHHYNSACGVLNRHNCLGFHLLVLLTKRLTVYVSHNG